MSPEEHDQLRAAVIAWSDLDAKVATVRQCASDLAGWLDNHPPMLSVPLSEIKVVRADIDDLIRKYEPKSQLPPNPHPKGTYLWAREENARKHSVRSPSLMTKVDADADWNDLSWTHEEFIATDWEVEP